MKSDPNFKRAKKKKRKGEAPERELFAHFDLLSSFTLGNNLKGREENKAVYGEVHV